MALGQSIKQNTIGLGIFAVVTAGVIAFTQLNTQTRIEQNERAAKSRALYEIMPRDSHDNILLEDVLVIDDEKLLGQTSPGEAYIALREGEVVGIDIPNVADQGGLAMKEQRRRFGRRL